MSRMLNLRLLTVLLMAVLIVFPRPAPAQAAGSTSLPEMLLTLDGIQGGFSEPPYKGAIEVHSYSLGAANDVSPGGGAGKAEFTDIRITKTMDSASLPLLRALAKGTHIKDGYLYFQNRNPKFNFNYMVIHFSELFVTGYQIDAAGETPLETVTLQAKSMLFKYTTMRPDGSPGQTMTLSIGNNEETAIMTKYHFDPLYATTAKGNRYIEAFKVTLKATAANSTVHQTLYRVNGGDWEVYGGPFTIYAKDTHTVEYYSTNKDGDIEKPNVMNFDTGTFTGNGSY